MKHTTLLFFTFVVVCALATAPASSYVRSTVSSSSGAGIAWNLSNPSPLNVSNGRITYNINSAVCTTSCNNLAFTEVEKALNASFKAWEDIPTCAVAFTEGPPTSVHSAISDNIFPIYWVESKSDSDYPSISSALAVTFTFRFTSGARTGEITDANMVFNGADYTWTTDVIANPSALDIAEVATHEIGHAIGLNHSPIGSATMFPRTGSGVTKSRTLSPDDQIAASLIYPTSSFFAATGMIQGKVVDGSNNNIFGAHVVATDSNGNVAASSLSQPDGTYAIQGLSPGNYTVFAAPLDSAGGIYFSASSNLGGFYNTVNNPVNTDFQTSADQSTSVTAGGSATINFTVNRVAPTMLLKLVRNPANSSYSNSGTTVTQGQSNLIIGVSGTGVPTSGTPLSVSGSGITALATSFTTVNGDPAVRLTINVAANAAPGGRNLIVTLPSGERSIVPGAVEVLRSGTTATVSAASFVASTVASDSIVSVFGVGLANSLAVASTVPLPTTLGGTTVQVTDSTGFTRPAPLFFVSGGQINYAIPTGTATGVATVTITNSVAGTTFTETIQIDPVAPGLFTATSDGQGAPAAVVRRFTNNVEVFPSVLAAQPNGTPQPINLGPITDQVILEMYGTGIRSHSAAASSVTVKIGGADGQVLYAGLAPGFVGLDQIDVIIPRSLIGINSSVDVVMTVDGRTANTVKVNIQ